MKLRSSSVIGSVLSPLLISLLLQGCGAAPGEGEALCGDGIVEASEQCDDGNLDDGDGCSADCLLEEGGEGLSEAEKIDQFIRSLDDIPQEEEVEISHSTSPAETTPDGNYSCFTENISRTVSLSSISTLTDPTSDLFPGALLAGNSLQTGQFAQVVFDRKPQTYSLSIQDGTNASRSATMQNPSLSEFRDTIGAILAQAQLNNVPIKLQANIQEVRSEQELELAIGFNLDTATLDVAGLFNFNNQQILSHLLMTVDATFFTAEIDPVANPSDLMADSVTLAEVQQKVGPGNPPVYVSSITYGTRFYIAVESRFSAQEVTAALQASFDGALVDADGEVTVSSKDILQESTFNFVAVGASEQQLEALNIALSAPDRFAALQDFATNPIVFSAANLGSPLSFTMKQLSNNASVAIAFSGTFDVLSCERISQNIQVTLKEISVKNAADGEVGRNDTLELFGRIRAQGIGAALDLFNFTDGQFITVSDAVPFQANGAQFQKVVRIDPRSDNARVKITADLTEDDGPAGPSNGDEDLPLTDLIITADSEGFVKGQPAGSGFNGEYELFIPTTSGDLTITVALKPIP